MATFIIFFYCLWHSKFYTDWFVWSVFFFASFTQIKTDIINAKTSKGTEEIFRLSYLHRYSYSFFSFFRSFVQNNSHVSVAVWYDMICICLFPIGRNANELHWLKLKWIWHCRHIHLHMEINGKSLVIFAVFFVVVANQHFERKKK